MAVVSRYTPGTVILILRSAKNRFDVRLFFCVKISQSTVLEDMNRARTITVLALSNPIMRSSIALRNNEYVSTGKLLASSKNNVPIQPALILYSVIRLSPHDSSKLQRVNLRLEKVRGF